MKYAFYCTECCIDMNVSVYYSLKKEEEEKQKLLWHSFLKLKQLNLLKEILYKKIKL